MENLRSILCGGSKVKKRCNRDRRDEDMYADFPVKTNDGYLVYKDRRIKPERRIRNINVSELVIREADFLKIFNKYQ